MLPSKLFLDEMFNLGSVGNRFQSDVYEKDGIICIEIDIPGFDKNDITIELDKGNLTVTIEKTQEEKEDNKKYFCRERKIYGKYQRSFYLGEVDEEQVNASFEKGILTISVPKKQEKETKKLIEIK